LVCLTVASLVLCGCESHLQHTEAAGEACPKSPQAPSLPIGCANLANLEAMVADPTDLTHGRTLTPASGAQAAGAVAAYEAPPVDPRPAAPSKVLETLR
jgi:hypothetical protein